LPPAEVPPVPGFGVGELEEQAIAPKPARLTTKKTFLSWLRIFV
jgi:hypothetical protein